MTDLSWITAGFGAVYLTLASYAWMLRRRTARVRLALREEER